MIAFLGIYNAQLSGSQEKLVCDFCSNFTVLPAALSLNLLLLKYKLSQAALTFLSICSSAC